MRRGFGVALVLSAALAVLALSGCVASGDRAASSGAIVAGTGALSRAADAGTSSSARSQADAESEDGSTSETTLSYDAFVRIEMGMSSEAVAQLLGSAGTEAYRSSSGGSDLSAYEWKGSSRGSITVTFKDNKAIHKSQSSLGDRSAATIDKAGYDKIEEGMTYAQVVKAVGSEGLLTSYSGAGDTVTESYSWYDPGGTYTGANAGITFRNGVVVDTYEYGLQ